VGGSRGGDGVERPARAVVGSGIKRRERGREGGSLTKGESKGSSVEQGGGVGERACGSTKLERKCRKRQSTNQNECENSGNDCRSMDKVPELVCA